MTEDITKKNSSGATGVREMLPGEEIQIMPVYRVVWKKSFYEFMKANWNWKFIQNPYVRRAKLPNLVYEKDGKIVGFFGIIVAPIKLGNQTHLCTFGADHMVDPDHRGTAGYKLAKHAYEHSDIMGARVGPDVFKLWKRFVPPISDSCHFHIYEQNVGILGTLADIKQGRKPWVKNKPKLVGFSTSVEIPSNLDSKLKEWCQSHDAISLRDEEWFQWRFYQAPTQKFFVHFVYRESELKGYVVFRKVNETDMRIVDYLANANDLETHQYIFAIAPKQAKALKCRRIIHLCTNILASKQACISMGYYPKAFNSEYLIRLVSPNPEVSERLQETSGTRWHLTFADSDLDMM